MKFQQIDEYAARLRPETKAAVHSGSKAGHEKRTKVLFDHYIDPDQLRKIAGDIKQHVVENLDTYLPAVEAKLRANGVHVHWAATAEAAGCPPPPVIEGPDVREDVAHVRHLGPDLSCHAQLVESHQQLGVQLGASGGTLLKDHRGRGAQTALHLDGPQKSPSHLGEQLLRQRMASDP